MWIYILDYTWVHLHKILKAVKERSPLMSRLTVKASSRILCKLCAITATELARQPIISALNGVRKCLVE